MLDAAGEPGPRGPSTGDRRIHYHTTWDTSPLGEAIRRAPDDPGAWSRWLIARGIGYVLVDYSELTRLVEKDHNFDPAVTIARVRGWINDPRSGVESVRRWGPDVNAGRVAAELFRISTVPGAAAGPTSGKGAQ
jgi:hypothetical protein